MAKVTEVLEIIVQAKETASKTIKGISGGLMSMGKIGVQSIGLLGGALGTAGGALLSLGSDALEMRDKFDIVFGVGAESAIRSLDALAEKTNANKFELQGYAATFQDTLVPMGLSTEKAQGFSIQMTKLAGDLASFNNMPMDEAVDRLRGTLVGSRENALAFGVVINENMLKAELAAQGWGKLTGSQLEAAKVQARMNLLMQGTTSALDNAEITSQSFANQMKGLKNTLLETATAMGIELVPVMAPFLAGIGEFARDVGPQAVEIFKQFAQELSTTLGPAMTIINESWAKMAESLGLASGEVTTTDVLLGILSGTLNAIVIAVQALAIAFAAVSEAMETARELGEQTITILTELIAKRDAMLQGAGFGGALDAITPDFLQSGEGRQRVAAPQGGRGSGAPGTQVTGNVFLDKEIVGKIIGDSMGQDAMSLSEVGGIASQ